MNIVDKLMAGAVDMHIHIAPDSLVTRRQDALQLAYSAREACLRAIVLKSRDYVTVPLALLVHTLVPEVLVFGSVTLDNEVGGVNPAAVLAGARMGAKVVWMPTFTAANSKAKTEASLNLKLSGQSQSILDNKGTLLPEVKEIVRIVKDYDIVLATGHLSPREVLSLVKEGIAAGLTKVVVTHVLQAQLMEAALSQDDILCLARMGAFIEYSFWTCRNTISIIDPKRIVESVKAVGAEHCILTTDFGQAYNPAAPEGMREFIEILLQNGLGEKEIEILVKENPARLLNLDSFH